MVSRKITAYLLLLGFLISFHAFGDIDTGAFVFPDIYFQDINSDSPDHSPSPFSGAGTHVDQHGCFHIHIFCASSAPQAPNY